MTSENSQKSDEKPQSRGVKTILRVLDVLEILEKNPEGLSLVEISTSLDLPKSTTHRILSVLLERQYARESISSEKYLLGFQILSLAKACLNSIDLFKESRPFLEDLNEKFNETVILGGFDPSNCCIIYLDKIDSSHSLRMVSHVGQRTPLHCTALGKAILSKIPEKTLRKILENYELKAFTKNSITDLDKLIDHLKDVNQKGFCVDNEEYKEHVSCVAAPICGFDQKPLGAISVSVPSIRFTAKKKNEIIEYLVNVSKQISELLSFAKADGIL